MSEEDKKLEKLRKYLGEKYHMCTTFRENGNEWVLYRKCRDLNLYYSEANKPIMSSNENTIDELEEYLKKHYEYDLYKIFRKASTIIMWISTTIFLINILTVNNKITTAISLGINIANLIYLIIYSIVDCHNWDVYLYESFEWLQKREKERN